MLCLRAGVPVFFQYRSVGEGFRFIQIALLPGRRFGQARSRWSGFRSRVSHALLGMRTKLRHARQTMSWVFGRRSVKEGLDVGRKELRSSSWPCPPLAFSCPANMAQIRQSRPDSGLGFQAKVFKTFWGVLSSLGNGHSNIRAGRTASEADLCGRYPKELTSQKVFIKSFCTSRFPHQSVDLSLYL